MATREIATINDEERILEAAKYLHRRMEGFSFTEIAREFKVPPKKVKAEIQFALEWRLAPDLEMYRSLEDARLDSVTKKLEYIISAPMETGVRVEHRLTAINSLLKVMEMRAKLQGLNAPVVVNTTVNHEVELSPDMQALIKKANEEADRTLGIPASGPIIEGSVIPGTAHR